MIATDSERAVDIGVAQPAEQALHSASKKQTGPTLSHVSLQRHGYFAHALTVGLNVEFARLATNVATRQRFGRMTYPIAALEVLRNHDPLNVELHFSGLAIPRTRNWQHRQLSQVDIEHTPLYCRALQVAVINAPIFGGQWQLSLPQSSMEDRLLDIVVFEDIDLSNLSASISRLFNHQIARPVLGTTSGISAAKRARHSLCPSSSGVDGYPWHSPFTGPRGHYYHPCRPTRCHA